MDGLEIWIVPLLNPDGRESSPPTHYNANGFDLNRSFPEGAWTNLGNKLYGPPLDTAHRQPEVTAIMQWSQARNVTLDASFHSDDHSFVYPYINDGLGSANSPPPDDAIFQDLALAYASNNTAMWAHDDGLFTHGTVNSALVGNRRFHGRLVLSL